MGTRTSGTHSDPWRYLCTECGSAALMPVNGNKPGREKDHNYRCDACGAKLKKRWDKKHEKLV